MPQPSSYVRVYHFVCFFFNFPASLPPRERKNQEAQAAGRGADPEDP